jgi:hypothetical protein
MSFCGGFQLPYVTHFEFDRQRKSWLGYLHFLHSKLATIIAFGNTFTFSSDNLFGDTGVVKDGLKRTG